MNSHKQTLKMLFEKAREESQPQVDVSSGVSSVLISLSSRSEQAESLRPLLWVASLSSAAAAVFVVTAFIIVRAASSDVVGTIYNSIVWVIQ